jgi:hypothetical protein
MALPQKYDLHYDQLSNLKVTDDLLAAFDAKAPSIFSEAFRRISLRMSNFNAKFSNEASRIQIQEKFQSLMRQELQYNKEGISPTLRSTIKDFLSIGKLHRKRAYVENKLEAEAFMRILLEVFSEQFVATDLYSISYVLYKIKASFLAGWAQIVDDNPKSFL